MRRFELRDDRSQKFWCVGQCEAELCLAWGRIGTKGQQKTKSYASAEAAEAALEKLIRDKVKKGYVEQVEAPEKALEPIGTEAPEKALGPIGTETPPLSLVCAENRRRGLVLGIGTDGAKAVAVGGQGRDLVLTTRDGVSFSKTTTGGKGLRGAFVDGEEIWVAGEWGFAARSTDGGQTWKKVATKTKGCLFGIVRDGAGRVWTAGDDGYLAFSKDGKTFKRVDGVEESIGRITSTSLGILIPCDDTGALYIVEDEQVRKTMVEEGATLMQATVTPRGALIAVGAKGRIWRSADQGATYARIEVPTRGYLCGVDCFPDGRVVAVGQAGVIYISFDDGETFETLEQHQTAGFLWCVRRHGDSVLIGGESGLILRLGGFGA